jgi:hypothetical protein
MNAPIDWNEALRVVITIIPSVIAAFSSLKNGKELREHIKRNGGPIGNARGKSTSPVKKRPGKNGQHPDWYKPPDL